MSIKTNLFSDGTTCISITNSQGLVVKILNLGGIIQSVILPNSCDVVLGYDSSQEYTQKTNNFFGAVIGRYANRISNAQFDLFGVVYTLEKNNGHHHLHGGSNGLHSKLFSYEILEDTLILSHTIKHLEDGCPGNLEIKIHYTLSDKNELGIEYFAVSDKDTIVNLSNHTYFNLDGHDKSALGNKLNLKSNEFTYNDNTCIPTGEILSVKGTALDFRKTKEIGKDIYADDVNLKNVGGFDHNYIVNYEKQFSHIATASGQFANMEVYTNSPCVQLYSGNNIADTEGKSGVSYKKHSGFCLETGIYPNAINIPTFKNSILKAGEQFNYKTIYKFEVL